MKIMGIDPGLTGGIAVVNTSTDGEPDVNLYVMPIIKNIYGQNIVDVHGFFDILDEESPNRCYIERIQLRNGQAGSMTSAGNFFRLVAMMEFYLHDPVIVHPQTWTSEIFSDVRGTENRKTAAINWCQELGLNIPTITQTGKKLSDGACEAFCIAMYGLRRMNE